MSRRSELFEVVHDLKQYLRWQRASGASGSVPASAQDREAFAAKERAREQQKLERLTGGHKEPAAADAVDAQPAPRAPVPQAITGDVSEAAPREDDAPDAAQAAPWKTKGSRPQRRFGAASKPQQASASSEESPAVDYDAAYPEAAGMARADGTDMAPQPDAGREPAPKKKPSEMTNREKLEFLREYLGDCQRCGLCEHRTNIAFGTGDPEARIAFVGEAPGYNEDQQGEPFVGKAGALLDKMIVAMGLQREQVYICNVIKCRPPDNRNPHTDEIRECSPFLQKQLEAVSPDVIVTLGKFAGQYLTGQDKSMGAMRGRWSQWQDVPVMPTYHPAYLLRSPDQKAKAWSDLQMVMKRLGLVT
jgi:uracil-DNA glycosylase